MTLKDIVFQNGTNNVIYYNNNNKQIPRNEMLYMPIGTLEDIINATPGGTEIKIGTGTLKGVSLGNPINLQIKIEDHDKPSSGGSKQKN